jgi:hypothetical protein
MSSVRFLRGKKLCTVTYNTVTQPKISIVTGKTYKEYFNYELLWQRKYRASSIKVSAQRRASMSKQVFGKKRRERRG